MDGFSSAAQVLLAGVFAGGGAQLFFCPLAPCDVTGGGVDQLFLHNRDGFPLQPDIRAVLASQPLGGDLPPPKVAREIRSHA